MTELQPHIRCAAGDVAEAVLLPGDPGRIATIAAHLDEWHEVAYNREFRTITGTYRGMPVSATSTGIGGPSAAIAVEELRRVGCKRFIRVGSSGGLQRGMRVGDLVIAVGAVREDGASAMYISPAYPAVADVDLTQALIQAAAELGQRAQAGVVRSHDSFYTGREAERMAYWSESGVLASDMETAALLTVARLRGAEAASILNVVVPHQGDLAGGINDLVQAKEAAAAGEAASIRVALQALLRLWQIKHP